MQDLSDFVNRLLATLPTTLDRVRDVVSAAQRVPQLENELAAVRAEKGLTEANTLESLQPLETALDQLRELVWPEAEASPHVTPVTAVEDVPAVLAGDLDPGDTTGRSDDGVALAESEAAADDPQQ